MKPALKVDRVGEKRIMNCGLEAEIICYRNYRSIDIKFSDNTVVTNRAYKEFERGAIRHPSYRGKSFSDIKVDKIISPSLDVDKRVGQVEEMNNGLLAEIICYRNLKDIDVRFEDGQVARHKNYKEFRKGAIGHPTRSTRSLLESKLRLGLTKVMNNGLSATIVDYINSRDISVLFEDNSLIMHTSYYGFDTCSLSSPTINMINGTTLTKDSYLSSFSLEKVAYRLEKPKRVYYICRCKNCGLNDILTPQEILAHNCEVI